MKGKLCFTVLLAAFVLAMSGGMCRALAQHPKLEIPEMMEANHKACQELMRLGNKYRVEGLFTKEFEENKRKYTRLDVARAVQTLTDKMAEKVAAEGARAIFRDDLLILSDLKEELQGEMLLVQLLR